MTPGPVTLILMRHGVAEGPDLRDTDEERVLTKDGLAAAGLAARGLVALGIDPDVVVSSPLIRCRQTAKLVAEAAGCPMEQDDRLKPGMTTHDVLDMVVEHPDARVIVMCTHQPGLSHALADLTGCGLIGFKRPGAAVIRLDSPRPGGGSLMAILPPRILRSAAS